MGRVSVQNTHETVFIATASLCVVGSGVLGRTCTPGARKFRRKHESRRTHTKTNMLWHGSVSTARLFLACFSDAATGVRTWFRVPAQTLLYDIYVSARFAVLRTRVHNVSHEQHALVASTWQERNQSYTVRPEPGPGRPGPTSHHEKGVRSATNERTNEQSNERTNKVKSESHKDSLSLSHSLTHSVVRST